MLEWMALIRSGVYSPTMIPAHGDQEATKQLDGVRPSVLGLIETTFDKVRHALGGVAVSLQQAYEGKELFNRLYALNDAQLKTLGLERSDIAQAVYGTVFDRTRKVVPNAQIVRPAHQPEAANDKPANDDQTLAA